MYTVVSKYLNAIMCATHNWPTESAAALLVFCVQDDCCLCIVDVFVSLRMLSYVKSIKCHMLLLYGQCNIYPQCSILRNHVKYCSLFSRPVLKSASLPGQEAAECVPTKLVFTQFSTQSRTSSRSLSIYRKLCSGSSSSQCSTVFYYYFWE